MTIVERFLLLPPSIDYAGFTFQLQFTEHLQYGLGIGYVMTGCHSKKRYKRQAWKAGYWEDKAVQRQLSTMYSNYLFFEPLMDSSDRALQQALEQLLERLSSYQLLQPSAYRRLAGDQLQICAPIRLLED